MALVTAAGTGGAREPAIALALASAALLAVRLYAASHVGFGDSEALYACYALHPQPAYLDHPGLIGVIARVIGGGVQVTPETAHHVTAVRHALHRFVPQAKQFFRVFKQHFTGRR